MNVHLTSIDYSGKPIGVACGKASIYIQANSTSKLETTKAGTPGVVPSCQQAGASPLPDHEMIRVAFTFWIERLSRRDQTSESESLSGWEGRLAPAGFASLVLLPRRHFERTQLLIIRRHLNKLDYDLGQNLQGVINLFFIVVAAKRKPDRTLRRGVGHVHRA